ncbi:MAG: hypothetical protein RJB57_1306 [Actinomycetota bacterium]
MKEPAPGQSESVAIAPTTVAGGATFTVTPPWSEGALIDPRHTCDNLNVSPAVSWANPPEGTASFAVILTDLDAPEYAHWTVANIDAASTGVTEGSVGDLAAVAMNSDAKPDYAGPCPPEGETHRYSLSVYAVSQVLEAQTGDGAPSLRAAIEAAALEVASTEFTYTR